MKTEELDARMRSMESFHALRMLDGVYPIIRVDGRGFSKFTANRFEKPFDERFHRAMVRTAEALLGELRAVYAYTESDEISVACPREWDFFNREVEKVVSVTASIAASTFSVEIGTPVSFDSRICSAVDMSHVVDYFRWRQADAARCALNGWCYWTLRKAGKKAHEATQILDGRDKGFKNELLHEHGVNFAKLPAWQRRGTGVHWEAYDKEGYNPVKKEKVVVQRVRARVNDDLPAGDDYSAMIESLMTGEGGPLGPS